MSDHARLSPSNLRWPVCPGSVRVEADYEDVAGDAAIDGTGSHLLLEMCVREGMSTKVIPRAEKWLDAIIGEDHPDKPGGWHVTQDRCDRVQLALDYINARIATGEVLEVHAEMQSNPGYYFGRKDWYGTLDVFLKGSDWIEVIDYKDGRGWVDVKSSSQFDSYAVGRLAIFVRFPDRLDLDATNIKLIRKTVIQPKTKTPIRFEELTKEEVWERGVQLAAAAALTDDPDAPLVPGKHCTWCKHGRAGNCTAKNTQGMEGMQLMVDESVGKNDLMEAIKSGDITMTDMPGDRLAAILDASAPIRKLLKLVDAEADKRMKEDCTSIPGYKMGYGNSKTVWVDAPEIVAKKLKGMRLKKDDIYPPKLITPTQALKFEGLTERQIKKLEEEMITKVNGPEKVVKDNKPIEDTQAMFAGVAELPDAEPIPAASFNPDDFI